MKKIFVDSDIFVRDLRYARDKHHEVNQDFLKRIRSERNAATSIFNVLEVCGILSFNLSEQDLFEIYATFTQHYQIKVLFPANASGNIDYDIPRIFEQIQTKQSLGDAQISYVVKRFEDKLSHFISWNAQHFAEKIQIPVLTPVTFMQHQ